MKRILCLAQTFHTDTRSRLHFVSTLRVCQESFCRYSSTASRSTVADLLNHDSSYKSANTKQITLNGYVRSVRKQKKVAFAAVSDGTAVEAVQVVLRPDQAQKLSTGVAVSITGIWQKSLPGTKQSHELHADIIKVCDEHEPATYPLQKKFHSLEFLRTLPHLRTRVPFNALLLRLRSQVLADMSHFFNKEGFVQTHPPIITSSDCEGGGEVFTVTSTKQSREVCNDATARKYHNEHFFRTRKHLSVSSQLHLEALCQSIGKVWAISPTFRAERSDTSRHLSEFYMLEAEICFIESIEPIMTLIECLLRYLVTQLQSSSLCDELATSSYRNDVSATENASPVAGFLENRWAKIVGERWPRISFHDAVRYLRDAQLRGKACFAVPPSSQGQLQLEHERFLVQNLGDGQPIFITNYPALLKPFYVSAAYASENKSNSERLAQCFDLLVPDMCELAGGSMREHKFSELVNNMKLRDMLQFGKDVINSDDSSHEDLNYERNSLDWYLDLRRYGSAPHGGFGLGLDRLLCYLSGVSNLRDMATFPRWYGRCDC